MVARHDSSKMQKNESEKSDATCGSRNTSKSEPFKKKHNKIEVLVGYYTFIARAKTLRVFLAVYFCCGGNGPLDDSPPSRQTCL